MKRIVAKSEDRSDKLKTMITFKSCLQFRQAMNDFSNGLNIDEEGNVSTKLYYTPKGKDPLPPDFNVKIYGNFTENPWNHYIDCKYDYDSQMFYHETHIKIGQQFKFLVGMDSHLVSK